MNKSTEEEILATLSKHDSMSVLELSISLNLTKADIRYHIKKLLTSGSINIVPPESGMRGRPAIRFKISNRFYSHNLVTLINALFYITTINDHNISKIADYYSTLISSEHSKSLITKFNTLIIGLNKQKYNARWETQFKGPVIYFSNCPYRQVVQNHPIICELDRRIVEVFLDKNVTTINTIAINGTINCKFQISI
jgi:predicted ArsR family transcriptional regulator